MIDITLASRSPLATSTTTVRATTAARPPPKPCTTRNTINNPIDGANAQPTAPRVQISPPTIIGLRRPRWSDSGPPSSCPKRHAEEERGQPQTDQRRRGGQVGCHSRKGWGVHVGRERRHRALHGQREDQRRGHSGRAGRSTCGSSRREGNRRIAVRSHQHTIWTGAGVNRCSRSRRRVLDIWVSSNRMTAR